MPPLYLPPAEPAAPGQIARLLAEHHQNERARVLRAGPHTPHMWSLRVALVGPLEAPLRGQPPGTPGGPIPYEQAATFAVRWAFRTGRSTREVLDALTSLTAIEPDLVLPLARCTRPDPVLRRPYETHWERRDKRLARLQSGDLQVRPRDKNICQFYEANLYEIRRMRLRGYAHRVMDELIYFWALKGYRSYEVSSRLLSFMTDLSQRAVTGHLNGISLGSNDLIRCDYQPDKALWLITISPALRIPRGARRPDSTVRDGQIDLLITQGRSAQDPAIRALFWQFIGAVARQEQAPKVCAARPGTKNQDTLHRTG